MKPAFYKSEVVTLFRRQFLEIEIFRRNFERLDEVFIQMSLSTSPLAYTDNMTAWLRGYVQDLSKFNSKKLKEFADDVKSNLKELNFKSEIVRQMKEIQSEVENEILEIWENLTSHQLEPEGNRLVMKFIDDYVGKVFQVKNEIGPVHKSLKKIKEEKNNAKKLIGNRKKRIQRIIKITDEKIYFKDPIKELKSKLKFKVSQVELKQLKSSKIVRK